MIIKLLEIRDRATFIPAMAIRLQAKPGSQELFLLRSAGYAKEALIDETYGEPYVILVKLDGAEAQYDPFDWPNQRTMGNAHRHVIDHWRDIESGDVVDVEFVLGESEKPKTSERFDDGGAS